MASSIDNLDFLDHLLFDTVETWFPDDSLSHLLDSIPSPSLASNSNSNSNSNTPRSCHSISISGSDIDSDSKRERAFPSRPIIGRVAKRKPRPSKKSPTTFITTDIDNFQQMVQQATGLRFPTSGEVSSAAHQILKPEAKRIYDIAIGGPRLPTLDTSASLLPPDKFGCFPTLESWKVM